MYMYRCTYANISSWLNGFNWIQFCELYIIIIRFNVRYIYNLKAFFTFLGQVYRKAIDRSIIDLKDCDSD